MQNIIILLLLIQIYFHPSTPAKILAIVPIPSYSHQIFFRPLWKQLAKRGHQLTLLTTDPMPETSNITQINWQAAYDLRHKKHNITDVVQENEYNLPKIMSAYQAMLQDIIQQELSHPEVENLLKSGGGFDLVMVEYHQPIMFGFAHRFNCPYIGISSLDIGNYYHGLLHNPVHPVLYPDLMLPFDGSLKFSERVLSTMFVFYNLYREFKRFNLVDDDEVLARKYFGRTMPKLEDLARNVSMIFLNTHPVFTTRPLGPRFVQIGGGMHLEEPQPLPQVIQKFLDSSVEGAVYFSLGTNVRSNHVTADFIKVFNDTFHQLPYKILWKFESTVDGLPDNVKIIHWAPQQDVLRHPNIKLFITQCGIQSLEEAILSHVPILAVPFVNDQYLNAKRITNRRIGLSLDRRGLSTKKIKAAVVEVITNPLYKTNIVKMAKLMQDQPQNNLEKAVWWTEFVIRNKGADFWNNSDVDIPFYQYCLLDVLGLVVTVLFISTYLLYRLIIVVKMLSFGFRKIKQN